MNKAQGTIEYLIIIAIIIVIGLVVVSLMSNFLSPAQGVGQTINKIGGLTNTISLTESSVTPDGNYLIRLANNSGEKLTISNVKIGDINTDYSEPLFQGNAQNFVVNTNDICTTGNTTTQPVTITYTTRYGITKTETHTTNNFNCENYTVPTQATPVYTTTFNSQDATVEADPTSKTVTSPETTVGTLPTPPTKTGYTFEGWHTQTSGGGTQFLANTEVTNDITIYAYWTIATPTYTVTFDSQDPFTPADPTSIDVISPETTVVTLPTEPTKLVFTFEGWYTQTNGEGTQFLANTQVTNNLTVYAYWVSIIPPGGGGDQ